MNESFLFPLATSAEPMQVTWKRIQRLVSGDERIIDPKTRLAEERNIDPKTLLAEERNVDPKSQLAEERNIDPKTQLAEEQNVDPKTQLAEERNIDPKTRSGGERFVHLPGTSLWIIFHVTCIGSVLVARENRNYLLILTGSSDTDLFTWPA